VSLIEVMISVVLMSLVVTVVDVSITVIQKQNVQVTGSTQALNKIQAAQEAITADIHAATTWNSPAPTTTSPVTATTLNFTASFNGQTPTVNIAVNTSTHQLSITCTAQSGAPASSCNGIALTVSNIDSATGFTLTASEVTNSTNSPANAFYYTNISSVVTLDTPSVTAPRRSQTTLTEPNLVPFNILYSCQLVLQQDGATGSC